MKKALVVIMMMTIGMAFVTGCKQEKESRGRRLINGAIDKKVDSDLRESIEDSAKIKVGGYTYGL